MICPRCKGENTDDSIVCSHCQLKLKTPCPRCKALNRIGQSVCSNCNLRLIRFCPQCKTPNFPNAARCRKCNFELLKPKKPTPQQSVPNQQQINRPSNNQNISVQQQSQVKPAKIQETVPASVVVISQNIKETGHEEVARNEAVEEPKAIQPQQRETAATIQTDSTPRNTRVLSRNEAQDTIIKAIKTAGQGFIVDISAPNGAGKSTLLSSLTQSLQDEKLIWLIGTCQPINQLLPYSFFQDLFKTTFGLPSFVSNIDESREALRKTLEASIDINDKHINSVLSRVLLNDFRECSSDIIENKEEIHNVISQVMESLNQKGNIGLIIEDFEYIDNASFECIKNLLSKGFLDKKNFILVNHQPEIKLHEQFILENIKNKILSVSLKSMTPEELNASLLGMLNNQDILPEKIKNKIFQLAKDIPLYMEQALWYLFQTGAVLSTETALTFNPQAENIDLPTDLDELIAARIKLIGNASPESIRVIMSASLFGNKFIPPFVQMMANIEEQQFNQVMQLLLNNGIFAMVDQFNVRFKHNWIWKVVYEQGFSEEQIAECGARILELYEKYTTNLSTSILARHAEEAHLAKETYIYYNLAIQESVYLGDPATFTEYQNKILELLPESELPEDQKLEHKQNIEEQIGKANFEFNPELAVEHLSNSILLAEKQNNIVKVIDLTGYLARSCEILGNFSGVIECCDKALSLIDNNKYQLESILLNYYKLESTFNLGRYEETIIHAINEILPALNKYISKNRTIPGISIADLTNIEYETELTLAKAYVYQGNKQAIDLTTHTANKAQKDNLPEYEAQALLLQSLFATIQGNTKACNSLLTVIKERFPNITDDKTKLYWYIIAALSNITEGNFQQAIDFCQTGISLATIFNEYNNLTLLKLALGRCYEELGRIRDAFIIYDEIVTYCSENKMATGALYSWYLAASSEFKNGDPNRAMEIAERALEVSQKPNIVNYLAEIMLHKIIAGARTIKGDFEGAQINIETAINIAENNDLITLLIDLYITFGGIYREVAYRNSNNAENNANIANRLYSKAIAYGEQIENHYLVAKADKEISTLLSFCKKSGLRLENLS